MIGRRALLRGGGIVLLATPHRTGAQPAKTGHRIGFVGGASASGYAALVDALRAGLGDHGYVEGRNVSIATPATLPIQQATRFECVVDLKAAKALGVTMPAPVPARADVVVSE